MTDKICREYRANRKAAYFLMWLWASYYTEWSVFLAANITPLMLLDFQGLAIYSASRYVSFSLVFTLTGNSQENVYAHAIREAKRDSSRLLNNLVLILATVLKEHHSEKPTNKAKTEGQGSLSIGFAKSIKHS